MKPTQGIPTALIFSCLAAQAWGAQDQEAQASGASDQEPPACILGEQALAQKQPDLAVIEYNKCLSKNPPTFKMLSNLGIAYAQQQKFTEAIQPTGKRWRSSRKRERSHQPRAGVYEVEATRRRRKSSLPSLNSRSAQCQYPGVAGGMPSPVGRVRAGRLRSGLGASGVAGRPFRLLYPGRVVHAFGEVRQAIPLMVDSLSQAKSADAYMTLGEAWLGVRNWPAARDAFRQAEKWTPSCLAFTPVWAKRQAALGEMDEAKASFLTELARDPGDFKVNYLLGQLDRTRKRRRSRKVSRKAKQLRPANPGPAYELPMLAMRNQDYQKAEAILESIVQNTPSFTNAHVLLAQAYSRLHKTEQGTRERAIAAALQKADHDRLKPKAKGSSGCPAARARPKSPASNEGAAAVTQS